MAGPGQARMLSAGRIIGRAAAALAAPWSRQIPPTIKVKATSSTATISSGVGPSYPNEVIRVRHPVFGPTLRNPRPGWVTNPHRPFLVPAAEAKADDAAKEIAKTIDDYCHDRGFKGSG
jgi:hypothetical protein